MPIPQPLQFFDPQAAFDVVRGRNLPHWLQSGVVAFLTWRTWDSMPAHVLQEWAAARANWLRARGVDERQAGWEDRLTPEDANRFREFVSERWETALDSGLGSCPFRAPENARIVADAFRHFDGTRYRMHDFVVMPNHVHAIVTFPHDCMRKQCESWKRFTPTELNRRLGRGGRFWASEAFDHLVRSGEQFEWFRSYIANNPVKAVLPPGEYCHYTEPHPEGAEYIGASP